MQIRYKTKKLERICEDAEEAQRVYGVQMAVKIETRIGQIISAISIEELLYSRLGGCHKLKGNRKNQYAMDLVHPYRLIFTQEDDITVSVFIEQIVDYH